VREKLWQAIDTLVGDGSIHQRLEYAAEYLIRLRPAEIPARERDDFADVMKALAEHPAEIPGEGQIRASVRKLTGEEAGAIGRKILSIYISLHGGI
jgi:ferric-dicitrate binding protein FerR (iron transport regulator)